MCLIYEIFVGCMEMYYMYKIFTQLQLFEIEHVQCTVNLVNDSEGMKDNIEFINV